MFDPIEKVRLAGGSLMAGGGLMAQLPLPSLSNIGLGGMVVGVAFIVGQVAITWLRGNSREKQLRSDLADFQAQVAELKAQLDQVQAEMHGWRKLAVAIYLTLDADRKLVLASGQAPPSGFASKDFDQIMQAVLAGQPLPDLSPITPASQP